MLKNVFEDIRKKGSFSFEKIIENHTMNDDEFFEFLKFIHLENIPEVRTSTDGSDFIVLEDENIFIEEKDMIKSYLEDIKRKYEELDKKSKNEKEREEIFKNCSKRKLALFKIRIFVFRYSSGSYTWNYVRFELL